jgi:hypothetical protein
MRIFLIIIISFFCYKLFGILNIDSFNNHYPKSDSCSKLFIRYFHESKNDSIDNLFSIWHMQYGLCEPLQRAIIIYHLKSNTFSDSILGDSISCNIMKYLDRRHNDYFNNEQYFSYVPTGKEFDKFTDSISKILISK